MSFSQISIPIKRFPGFWDVSDCKANPRAMFIFGDNDCRFGKKGQAVIRDEPNAFGVPTKKHPSYKKESYYTDEEYIANVQKITNAINRIVKESVNYDCVFIPENDLGTGLADLPNKAPKTFAFLMGRINCL
jgi:hypothetical protein